MGLAVAAQNGSLLLAAAMILLLLPSALILLGVLIVSLRERLATRRQIARLRAQVSPQRSQEATARRALYGRNSTDVSTYSRPRGRKPDR